ncbi:MAG: M23 family metallopeptidase [Prevotellaceae bacterium]|jgi:hypothetical protein|nr:M23 family metallopeptidase [Prevotellaceae bacterium]
MKTKIFFTTAAFYLFGTAFAQQNPMAPVQSKWEWTATTHELNYYNSDYCDYFLVSSRNKELWITSGKNNLLSMPREQAAKYRNDPSFLPSSFRTYKGYFPEKSPVDALYALPVRAGDSTKFTVEPDRRLHTYLFRIESFDTVFATRGGVICKNNDQGLYLGKAESIENNSNLLVYHYDRTFALYGRLSKTFVREGQQIEIGQPIGLAQEKKRVSVAFFFLDKNKFTGGKPNGSPHTFFKPSFHTANEGKVQLEEKTTYISQISDEMITQDMSKREKKKYEKKKLKAAGK